MAEKSVDDSDASTSFVGYIISEIICSPINLALCFIALFLFYKIMCNRKCDVNPRPPAPKIPPLKKKDMTYEELRKLDGTNEEGRICVAVNGKVFDVTQKGKCNYGPGAPYQAFAGRDATRGLATFALVASEAYDDLSDLNSMQMEGAKEWEMQFIEKYIYVGRLLKPGEEPTDYSEEEDTSQSQNTLDNQVDNSSFKKDE